MPDSVRVSAGAEKPGIPSVELFDFDINAYLSVCSAKIKDYLSLFIVHVDRPSLNSCLLAMSKMNKVSKKRFSIKL